MWKCLLWLWFMFRWWWTLAEDLWPQWRWYLTLAGSRHNRADRNRQEQTHIAQDLVPSPRHTDTTFNIQHSTVQISEITTFSLFIAIMNNREKFLQSNCQWFIKIYNKCFDAYHQLKATCVFLKKIIIWDLCMTKNLLNLKLVIRMFSFLISFKLNTSTTV